MFAPKNPEWLKNCRKNVRWVFALKELSPLTEEGKLICNRHTNKLVKVSKGWEDLVLFPVYSIKLWLPSNFVRCIVSKRLLKHVILEIKINEKLAMLGCGIIWFQTSYSSRNLEVF